MSTALFTRKTLYRQSTLVKMVLHCRWVDAPEINKEASRFFGATKLLPHCRCDVLL
jgi:hypothetical protein